MWHADGKHWQQHIVVKAIMLSFISLIKV